MASFYVSLIILVSNLLIIAVYTGSKESQDRCDRILHLGLAIDDVMLQLTISPTQHRCLNVTTLDIRDFGSLNHFYSSWHRGDLVFLYISTVNCNGGLLLTSALYSATQVPVLILDLPPFCGSVPMETDIVQLGLDWLGIESLITAMARFEDVHNVVLIQRTQELLPITDLIKLSLSDLHIHTWTYYIDSVDNVDISLWQWFCDCFLICQNEMVCHTIDANCTNGTDYGNTNRRKSYQTLAVFWLDSDDLALAALEKILTFGCDTVLWVFPVSDVDRLYSRCYRSSATNVFFISPDRKSQIPKLDSFLDSILNHLNRSPEQLNMSNAETTGIEDDAFYQGKRNRVLLKTIHQLFPSLIQRPEISQNGHFALYQIGQSFGQMPLSSAEGDDQDEATDWLSCTNLTRSGSWSARQGFQWDVKATDNRKLPLKTFIIGTVQADPFTILTNGSWSGFSIDLTKELMLRLGLRYRIIESFDGGVGSQYSNGTWSGLVRMAQLKQIDLAIGPITLTPARAEVIDFTQPIMEDGGGIIVKKVEDKIDKLFSNFRPFRPEVWFTLYSTLIVTMAVFVFVNWASPFQMAEEGYESIVTHCVHKKRDSAWVLLSSFMDQGVTKFPYNTSGRLLLGCWWIFSILISASFTAELAASLTVSSAREPINSLSDLVHQTDIIPIARQGGTWNDLLRNGDNGSFQQLGELARSAPNITTTKEGMDMVLSGGYALITDHTQVKALVRTDCVNLVAAEEIFYKSALGFFVPKGSPWRKRIGEVIVQMHQAGIISKFQRIWWSEASQCPDTGDKVQAQSQSLETSGAQFIIFLAVTVVAILIGVTECMCYKFYKLSFDNYRFRLNFKSKSKSYTTEEGIEEDESNADEESGIEMDTFLEENGQDNYAFNERSAIPSELHDQSISYCNDRSRQEHNERRVGEIGINHLDSDVIVIHRF